MSIIAALSVSRSDKKLLYYQALAVDRQAAPRTMSAVAEGLIAGPLAALEAVIVACKSQGVDVEDGVGVERALRKFGHGRVVRKVHTLRFARNLDAHPVGNLAGEIASVLGALSGCCRRQFASPNIDVSTTANDGDIVMRNSDKGRVR